MLNLFKSKIDVRNWFDISAFISENKILILSKCGNDSLELTYNQSLNVYEARLYLPMIDENGKEISTEYQKAYATYQFTPMYCKRCGYIYTVNDFELKNFNKTKKEALKELLTKLEQL